MFGGTTNGFRKERFPRRRSGHPPIRRWVRGLVGVAAAGWAFSPARAEIGLIEENGASVNFGLEAAAGYFHTANTNFGAGRVDLRSEESTGDARWSEGYLKPSLNAACGFDRAGKLYGAVTGVGTFTAGDGDAGGHTNSGDDDTDLERPICWARSSACTWKVRRGCSGKSGTRLPERMATRCGRRRTASNPAAPTWARRSWRRSARSWSSGAGTGGWKTRPNCGGSWKPTTPGRGRRCLERRGESGWRAGPDGPGPNESRTTFA